MEDRDRRLGHAAIQRGIAELDRHPDPCGTRQLRRRQGLLEDPGSIAVLADRGQRFGGELGVAHPLARASRLLVVMSDPRQRARIG